jgi:hypothetical protein
MGETQRACRSGLARRDASLHFPQSGEGVVIATPFRRVPARRPASLPAEHLPAGRKVDFPDSDAEGVDEAVPGGHHRSRSHVFAIAIHQRQRPSARRQPA